jgi:hypothetical protein
MLKKSHWMRFHHYATHVRTLTFDESKFPWDSFFTSQWAEILLYRSTLQDLPRELLPSLLNLEWRAKSIRCLRLGMFHFVRGGLLSLHISFLGDDSMTGLPALFECLESACPKLMGLSINFVLPPQSPDGVAMPRGKELARILNLFSSSLVCLRTDAKVFRNIVKHAPSFPLLQCLRLDNEVQWKGDDLPKSGTIRYPRLFFPSLRHVDARAPAYVNWICILGRTIKRMAISSAEFRSSPQYGIAIAVLFKEVGKSCLGLTSIRVTNLTLVDIGDDFGNPFAALLQCTSLIEVEWCTNIDLSFRLQDADIIQMAQAWPVLTTLIIRDSSYTPPTIRPTLSSRSIIELIDRCPNIRMVSLSVHISEVELAYHSWRDMSAYKLFSLDLCHSWFSISSPSLLAGWLCELCPSTSLDLTFRDTDSNWDDIHQAQTQSQRNRGQFWNDMKLLLVQLQRAREKEWEWRRRVHLLKRRIRCW